MSVPRGYALALVCLAFLSGCAQRRVEEDVTQEDGPWHNTRHWIHDEKLREVMDTLVAGQSSDLNEADGGRQASETNASLTDAETYATALSAAADGIRSAVQKHKMSAADRAAFDAQVETLRDQAAALAEAARATDVDSMRRLVDQIDRTCIACHTRFRDYSGLLEPYRKADKTLILPTPGKDEAARYAVGKYERLP